MTVRDDELGRLNFRKHILIRQVDKHDITKEDFNERIRPINQAIKNRLEVVLEEEKAKIKQKQEDDAKMAEEQPEEQPVKVGRKTRANSNATIITNLLMKSDIKSVEEVLQEFDKNSSLLQLMMD